MVYCGNSEIEQQAAMLGMPRELWSNRWLAALAAISFILMPAVITAAHEAKPHLAGVVLVLLAVYLAIGYVERGRWRWLWI